MRTVVSLALITAVALVGAGCGEDDNERSDDTKVDPVESPDEMSEDGVSSGDDTGADAGAGTQLTAEVGPGFEISLKDAEGEDVTQLAAGDYTIKVEDKSDQHNFHLTGGGVDESTTVAEETETTWNVTLQAGSYTYVCDPHASSMKGSFTVA